MNRVSLIATMVGLSAAGFAAGLALGRGPMASAPTVEAPAAAPSARGNVEPVRLHERRRPGSDLVAPLLACETPAAGGLEAVEARVAPVIAAALARGDVSHVGLYVHDLVTGQWLGHEPDAPFAPASLVKVPILIALLRIEEDERGTVEREVFYPDWLRDNDRQSIAPHSAVKPGRSWPLSALAEAMIVESDNNAARLVRNALPADVLVRVYLDLGWEETPAVVDGVEQMGLSPRSASLMFRALFNATYLGDGTSSLALGLMTRTSMRDGLVAGVPPDVVVAHKFGEWWNARPDGMPAGQFHDCGIVYRPGRPYVACVMTRGPDQRPLIELVAEISRALWSGFEALPPAG